ncbi:hypothetical protein ACHAXR_011501 [Thalassiosira sp. AJA248-18]
MNLFSILLFVASSTPSVSVEDSNDFAGSGSPRLHPSRSMLRKANIPAAKKESRRDESIPLLEETSFNQGNRVLAKDCGEDEKYLRLDMTTDDYGFENDWKLKMRQGNKWSQIEAGPPDGRNYGKSQRYIGGYCLSAGDYKFIITDLFKDGMCCTFGKGKYTGYVGASKIFSSPDDGEDWEKRVHAFAISTSNASHPPPTKKPTPKPNSSVLPFNPKIGMTTRDTDWLESHNTRRKEWHERYGKTYVPLKWSNALKDESQNFAEKLLEPEDACGNKNNIHGENLASNNGSGSWAEVRSTDSVLARWVEDEADDPYPANGHLTAVLWRASKYVGCGEASKPRKGGGMCHAQVCRYTRPGNCNMNGYKTNQMDWWIKPVMQDDSPCGPECPPDGC